VPQASEQQRCMSLAQIAQKLTELVHDHVAPGVSQNGEARRQVSSLNGPHGTEVTTPADKPLILDTLDPLLMDPLALMLDTLNPLLLDPLPLIIAIACTIRIALESAPSLLIICTSTEVTAGMLWTNSATDHKDQGDHLAAIAQNGAR